MGQVEILFIEVYICLFILKNDQIRIKEKIKTRTQFLTGSIRHTIPDIVIYVSAEIHILIRQNGKVVNSQLY